MPKELEKTYNSKDFEDDIYAKWEQSGLFNPEEQPNRTKDTYTISVPPPNATGILHLGHASMLSYQDTLIRHNRMLGKKTLWLPGEDHAALATNAKIEKQLENEGTSKHVVGREEFIKKVNAFVLDSRNTIRTQMKKMGSSLDWSRERYTLDEGLSRVVRIVFKKMYDDGLIYRGARIVNWDYKLQTTVSDDELERKEEKAPFYYFKYGPFTIGTARPETKFGDKYVVMHPDDTRYAKYEHGQTIDVEWINGPITATIIKDEAVDMDFGSGVMTITPWHDATDFEISQRHNLDREQIIDFHGKLLPIAQEFAGMHIEEAREKIVAKLKKKGLLEKIDENYVHSVIYSDRGGVIIEPQIMEQWFVDVHKKVKIKGNKYFSKGASLVEVASKVVKNGEITITPDRFNKTYFHWMDNLHDWCISRQIWFGHRIPVYNITHSDGTKETICSVEDPAENSKYKGATIEQDPDTLDTWFSSGIWTFSTLMNEESKAVSLEELIKESPDMQYHPTQVLETGYDIIFTWVARMILMTTYALGEIPFEDVYFHGLVKDKQGRKMSKSLGNGIDPLDMIEKYGADALRLSMMVGASPGNDLRLYEEKIASYRNFINKFWNICRYILMTVENPAIVRTRPKPKTLADEWILAKLDAITVSVTNDLASFAFSKSADDLRHFTWDDLADWYLEIAKVEGNKDEILLYILYRLLILWHPFTPFVTEVIWEHIKEENDAMLLVERWAEKKGKTVIPEEFTVLQECITSIRHLKSEYNISPKMMIPVTVSVKKNAQLFEEQKQIIETLSRVTVETITKDVQKIDEPVLRVSHMSKSTGLVTIDLRVEGILDIVKEKKRLESEIKKLDAYRVGLKKKLDNKDFVKNAPAEVVKAEKEKLHEVGTKVTHYKQQLDSLS